MLENAVLILLWIAAALNAAGNAPADSASGKSVKDSLNMHRADTAKTAAAVTAGAAEKDSLKIHPADASKSSNSPPTPPPEDTLYHFWKHPYWSFGAGWGLGSFPLFTQWERGLRIRHRTGRPEFPNAEFTVAQPADAYYIVWPFLLSFTPLTTERSSLSVESSWYFLFSGKSFLAALQNDSAARAVRFMEPIVRGVFFLLRLAYRHVIPEEYFKVDGVQQTSVVLGVSVTPLFAFPRSSSFSSSQIADSTLTALRSHIDNRDWNGAGIGWKLGISTIKKLTSHSGLQMDLVYIGRLNGFFSRGLQWKDISLRPIRRPPTYRYVKHLRKSTFPCLWEKRKSLDKTINTNGTWLSRRPHRRPGATMRKQMGYKGEACFIERFSSPWPAIKARYREAFPAKRSSR